MKRITNYIIICLCCIFTTAYSQTSEINIKRIVPSPKDKALFIEFSAIENGSFTTIKEAPQLEVIEIKDDQQLPMKIFQVNDIAAFENVESDGEDKAKIEEISILFVIDQSGSMLRENAFSIAKEAIKEVVKEIPATTNISLSCFHDIITKPQALTRENVESVLNNIEQPKSRYDTDLYRAIAENIPQLKAKKGKRILVVLSDGKNDTGRNPYYNEQGNRRLQPQEIYDLVGQLDSNFLVFPVGLGSGIDRDFLQIVADSSASKEDKILLAQTPSEISDLFSNILFQVASNNGMLVESQQPVYYGGEREIIVKWVDKGVNSKSKSYSLGTSGTPYEAINPKKATGTDIIGLLILLLLGLFAIGTLFALLSIIIPIRKKAEFKKKYIKRFKEVKRSGVREMDPISMEQFKDDDLVVVKCSKTVSLNTWKSCGDQCPYYPDCIGEEDCKDGEGMGKENFFSEKNKQFNWTWFGATGGMMGWIIFAGFQLMKQPFNSSFWQMMVDNTKDFFSEGINTNDFVTSLSSDSVEGFAIGFGLGLALTYAEELGQSRKQSWLRIILRALAIGLISYVIFAFGTFFEKWLQAPWLGGTVKAVLFGLLLGLILSIKSTISTGRGILGGLIAAVAGFLVYFPLVQSNFGGVEAAKLVSFLLLGAILGVILVSVVAQVEDFKLEYIQPAKYRRTNPISKWLKAGIDIEIGTNPGCYVFVKWTDTAVQPRHAKLSFDGKRVKLFPYHDVFINGRMIPTEQEYLLSNNDIISFSTAGTTKMRYIEDTNSSGGSKKKQTAAPTPNYTTQNRPKPSIKITRRTPK